MESIAFIIASTLLGILAVFLFFIAYCQHKEKSFIFTDAWLLSPKKDKSIPASH